MSSWLLLAWLVACLRSGAAAEGDALPAALVELVRNNPISSIEDLQLLLLTDSIDEDDGTLASNGGHRLPRSLDAQPAQQALCKVRTEVVEVTRAMLDRSNANFLLWPPCVEVQRCSGCCNTKSLQCVPVVTHTRYLQVMKIEYINKRPTYAKAVVSVVDHVECRCQDAPRLPAPRKKYSRRQHLHRNQTLIQEHAQGQVKAHSKDELHHLDELKQNQRSHLEDLFEQQWSPRGDTFTKPGEGYSVARSGEAILFGPNWTHNTTKLFETIEQKGKQETVARKDDNKTLSSSNNVGIDFKNKLMQGVDGLLRNSSDGNSSEGTMDTQTHETNSQAKVSPTEEPFGDGGRGRPRPTKEPNPDPRVLSRQRGNNTPEEWRILEIEEAKLEEERKELLFLHKRLDQEKEILRQQQIKREQEERQREKEASSQKHLRGKHLHHLPTTQKPETTTSTTTTKKPSAPAGPRPPAHPGQRRKKMRKNRKQISKAAMRAMLM
ncbi:uncharacterized protein pdgfbb isoform 2-T2 [Pholidichthys leucotaenia]